MSVRNDRDEYSEDVHGVRQMIIYGLKGMASYARHAELVGKADSVLGKFVHEVNTADGRSRLAAGTTRRILISACRYLHFNISV